MDNIVWQPFERQRIFMQRPEYEVLYGGAAGGGKSDALIIEALRQVDNPNYRAIIFRKTFPQCRELIIKSLKFYKSAFPRAKYNSTSHIWTFPSGATVMFGSMPNKDSYLQYQGHEYSYIGFDELTHFTQEEYEYLISRNRSSDPKIRCYIRATANPGGIGHGWVKERFITAMPPNTTARQVLKVTAPDGRVIERETTKRFVPSSVFDNPALRETSYVTNLAMLPDAKRRALLDGNWDVFSGQVFTEWRNNPDGYARRTFTHVIKPFPIPRHWRRYRSFDFGYAKPFTVQWWAVDTDGRVYLYRQLYGCTDTPNEGVKWEPVKIAREIRRIEDEQEKGNTIIGVADPSIWDESRGRAGTVINMMEREGVYFSKGKNDRISGKMQLHYRLAFDDKGYPMMYVFDTCKPFIRTLPNLVYSQTDVEDIDTTLEDHDYDACRYFLMENPIKARSPETDSNIYAYNPLAD